MEFTAQMISDFLNGEIIGNPEVKVTSIAKIEEGTIGTLTFLSNPKYNKFLYSTQSSIILVNKEFIIEKEIKGTVIKVENAYESLALLLELYDQAKPKKTGIDKNVYISENAEIGKNAYIASFSYIGDNAKIGDNAQIYPNTFIGDNVKIGDNVLIYAGVKIYDNCEIGNNCIFQAGCVIGSDGFGFALQSSENYKKVPQVGNVVIKNNVEIGANSTVDRATMGSTIIGDGVKIDNLVQIAHNVQIGENTVIAALAGISGSTKLGKRCVIAGQVGMSGHISIADDVKVGAQSGIGKTVTEKGVLLQGTPAFKLRDQHKSYVIFRRLPELKMQIEKLEKEIQLLKS